MASASTTAAPSTAAPAPATQESSVLGKRKAETQGGPKHPVRAKFGAVEYQCAAGTLGSTLEAAYVDGEHLFTYIDSEGPIVFKERVACTVAAMIRGTRWGTGFRSKYTKFEISLGKALLSDDFDNTETVRHFLKQHSAKVTRRLIRMAFILASEEINHLAAAITNTMFVKRVFFPDMSVDHPMCFTFTVHGGSMDGAGTLRRIDLHRDAPSKETARFIPGRSTGVGMYFKLEEGLWPNDAHGAIAQYHIHSYYNFSLDEDVFDIISEYLDEGKPNGMWLYRHKSAVFSM